MCAAGRPPESETALSFSALGDLLDPVLDEASHPLAAGQRSALARALVLEVVEGPAPDPRRRCRTPQRARGFASTRDLLVAIDDVQWLDAATAAALAYAARRLRAEHVGLLLARRAGLQSSLFDELRRRRHRSLQRPRRRPARSSLHCTRSSRRISASLSSPLLAEVHQASGGNPFYALEIVRTLSRSGVSVEAGKPCPCPTRSMALSTAVCLPCHQRVGTSWRGCRACASDHLDHRDGVWCGSSPGSLPALEARIVEIEGDRFRFTHPLLAAGALETADPQHRSQIHARLAELLEDPEARAWQLAASSTSRTSLSRPFSRTLRSTPALEAHLVLLLSPRARRAAHATVEPPTLCGGRRGRLPCTSSPVTRAGREKARDVIAQLHQGRGAQARRCARADPPVRRHRRSK